ncbi:hypothetical protein COLO4_22698 [Corchorus olitorius]|uniref:Uncharacterized protein n=1 Tax=Corchorus olitorius TaxID=93759 RepID=A0A1R3IKH4_9ROSI|nr:hypothetical protein COLO4_22698 [Corchorus olitorius]
MDGTGKLATIASKVALFPWRSSTTSCVRVTLVEANEAKADEGTASRTLPLPDTVAQADVGVNV